MKKSFRKYDAIIDKLEPAFEKAEPMFAKIDQSLDFLLNTTPLLMKVTDFASYLENLLSVRQDESGEILVSEDLAVLGRTIGAGVASSLKATFMGQLSGQARLDKGLKSAMAKDFVEEKIPFLGLLDQFTGMNTKKYITQHPEQALKLAQYAAPLLKNFQGKGGGGGSW